MCDMWARNGPEALRSLADKAKMFVQTLAGVYVFREHVGELTVVRIVWCGLM